MNDKTLVERLRNLADEWFEMCDDIHEPLYEAATRIEALEARLEIEPSHPYDGIDARDETIRLLEQRIETLEAGNRKLCLDLLAALGQNADALESQP